MRNVALAAVAVAALVAAAVTAWLLRPGPEAPLDPAPVVPALHASEIPPFSGVDEPSADKLRVAIPPGPTAEAACDGSMLWLAADGDCADVLDAVYLDRMATADGPLFAHPVDWSPPDGDTAAGTPTWRELLADPLGDRAAAVASLARAECLAVGDQPPPGAAECAGEAIARAGLLQEACVMALTYYEQGFNPYAPDDEAAGGPSGSVMDDAMFDDAWYWHVEDLNSNASLSQDEYWRRRAAVDEARRLFGWRLMRCRQVPRNALAWIPSLRTPTGEPLDSTQAPTLAIIAARLGVSWVRQPDADELLALRRYSRQ